MRKRASIEFVKTKEVAAPVLKFGGEPFGLPKELWPTSRRTREPMQFICQIPFGPDHFAGTRDSMAYVFMTSSDGTDETWNPDSGENAVIILPKEKLTTSLTVGDAPRLYKMVKKLFHKTLTPETCIHTGNLSFTEDPDFIPHDRQRSQEYLDAIAGNKIGGAPFFIQSDELPFQENWHLLLQIDSTTTPFWINFGDAGIGYVFLNADGTQGKFLWQCA